MNLIFFSILLTLSIVDSTVMNCKFENYVWGGYTGSQYACILLNDLSIQKGGKITGVSGEHERGKTNANVRGLRVEDKILNYIPEDIAVFFPNIIALTYTNTNLTEIHEKDFKPFPNLRVLWIQSNKIEVLEANLFRSNPTLGEISFIGNKLRHISVRTFSILAHLSYLYLDLNSCINARATTQATVPALIYEAILKCFSVETDPIFETCDLKNRQLQDQNKSLESELKKVNKKLKKCQQQTTGTTSSQH